MEIENSVLTAIVGLGGAIVGGVASFGTAWLSQSVQSREKNQQAAAYRRERLYAEFVKEGARLFADALSHQKDDVSDLVELYAMVAHIRLVASPHVVSAAEGVLARIIKTYGEPNRTLSDLRVAANDGKLDPLFEFSRQGRRELFGIDLVRT
jgi:hypothetical protein